MNEDGCDDSEECAVAGDPVRDDDDQVLKFISFVSSFLPKLCVLVPNCSLNKKESLSPIFLLLLLLREKALKTPMFH